MMYLRINVLLKTVEQYFRLALFFGATIGWQNEYTPYGMSIQAKEIIWFNLSSTILKEPGIEKEEIYPLKMPEMNKVTAILERRKPSLVTLKRNPRNKL